VDLLSTRFYIKIADLGLAKQMKNLMISLANTNCGSPLYMSPQALYGNGYSYKTDIWGIGALYFQLITGMTPFNGLDYSNLIENYQRGTYIIPSDLDLTLDCLMFIDKCLQYKEEDRISYEDMIKLPYITDTFDENLKLYQNSEQLTKIKLSLKKLDSSMESGYKFFEDRSYSDDNAIIMNIHDPNCFHKVYKHTMEVYQKQLENGRKNEEELKLVIDEEEKERGQERFTGYQEKDTPLSEDERSSLES